MTPERTLLLAMLALEGITGTDAETCLDALTHHLIHTPTAEPSIEAKRAAIALGPKGGLFAV